MKKKVLFFHFDLGGGGAEKVLINLLNQLDLNKYDITLFTLFGCGVNERYLNRGVRHKYLFKRTFRGLTSIMKLFSPSFLHKILIREYYDVEIAYLENSPTRIISGCRNSNTRKIAWVHVQIDDVKRFFSPYRSLQEAKKCYSNFDTIVFVSKFLENNFLEKTGWDFLSTQVIYNTVDIKKIREMAMTQSSFIVENNVLNLCSVGRLVYQKGYDRLLPVLLRLKNENYKFHFYILGTGELYNNFINYCKSHGLDQYVTFLGYQENPYAIISKMDLFVCSSRREGFSTAVTEAILLNIPVLTTACSGMDEILLDGKYGMIVENDETALYNGLKMIMNDHHILSEYKQNMREEMHMNDSVIDVENLIDL